eukprot:15450981-Alexandrium_andersonii.AAC.1
MSRAPHPPPAVARPTPASRSARTWRLFTGLGGCLGSLGPAWRLGLGRPLRIRVFDTRPDRGSRSKAPLREALLQGLGPM